MATVSCRRLSVLRFSVATHVVVSRGRGLGGSTCVNIAAYVKPPADDVDGIGLRSCNISRLLNLVCAVIERLGSQDVNWNTLNAFMKTLEGSVPYLLLNEKRRRTHVTCCADIRHPQIKRSSQVVSQIPWNHLEGMVLSNCLFDPMEQKIRSLFVRWAYQLVLSIRDIDHLLPGRDQHWPQGRAWCCKYPTVCFNFL